MAMFLVVIAGVVLVATLDPERFAHSGGRVLGGTGVPVAAAALAGEHPRDRVIWGHCRSRAGVPITSFDIHGVALVADA